MSIVNLTPHPINVYSKYGIQTIPPSGTVARVATVETDTDSDFAGVPVVRRSFGDVLNLPEDPNVRCIVSAMVLSAVPGRPNTYAPDTGPTAVRDDNGNILGVTRFVAA